MVTNSFEKRNFMSQWEGSAYTHEQFNLFFVGWGGEGEGLFVFFPSSRSVPIMFPSNSQSVPDAFPTLFPIALGFCAI